MMPANPFMPSAPPSQERTGRLEKQVARVLRAGVTTAAAVVLVSGLFYLARYGAEPVQLGVFRGEPEPLRRVPGILNEAARLGRRACIQFGLLLLIVAASSWAVANVLARRLGPVNAVALASWASLYAVPPLLLLSVLLEGAGTDLRALRDMDAMSWLVVGFQAYPATLFGFGLWAMLMRRYPAAQIAPFTLLVPVSGMLTAALVLHEPLQAWKLAAAAMVVGGLALNQIPSLRHRLLAQRA